MENQWKPISESPKYPLDVNYHSPKFIVIDEDDNTIHEAFWMHAHPMSQNYKDNAPPSLSWCYNNSIQRVRAKFFMEIPELVH